jgi:hypothetical protein
MTDYRELVKRLRERAGQYDEYGWHSEIELESADALEAQAQEIAQKDARIAELEVAIEPFRQVKAMLFRQIKAITSIYEYVPVEALRDDGEFNFKMTGAEIKRIYAALKGEK